MHEAQRPSTLSQKPMKADVVGKTYGLEAKYRDFVMGASDMGAGLGEEMR